MFNWLYQRIAKGVITLIQDWLSQKETIEDINKLVDHVVDRQIQRVYGKFGGTMKGVNSIVKQSSPLGIAPDLNLNAKDIIGNIIMGAILGDRQKSSQSANNSGTGWLKP